MMLYYILIGVEVYGNNSQGFLPLVWQAECKGENKCDHQSMTTGISVSRGAECISGCEEG